MAKKKAEAKRFIAKSICGIFGIEKSLHTWMERAHLGANLTMEEWADKLVQAKVWTKDQAQEALAKFK